MSRFKASLIPMVALVLLLAGCGRLIVVPSLDIVPGFEPTALGFEVRDGEVAVASHIITFTAMPGSLGAIIEGYRIVYYDNAGAPINGDDSTFYGRDSLGIYVPSGVTCTQRENNPNHHCRPGDEGFDYAPSSVSRPNVITLDSPVVESYLLENRVGDRAEVFFNGRDSNGRSFVIGPFEIAVAVPVTSGN